MIAPGMQCYAMCLRSWSKMCKRVITAAMGVPIRGDWRCWPPGSLVTYGTDSSPKSDVSWHADRSRPRYPRHHTALAPAIGSAPHADRAGRCWQNAACPPCCCGDSAALRPRYDGNRSCATGRCSPDRADDCAGDWGFATAWGAARRRPTRPSPRTSDAAGARQRRTSPCCHANDQRAACGDTAPDRPDHQPCAAADLWRTRICRAASPYSNRQPCVFYRRQRAI